MAKQMPAIRIHRVRWLTPPAVLFAGLFLGVAVGAFTNAVNVQVSEQYFSSTMGWTSDVVPLTVRQGMLEGGALGLFFGFVFSIAGAASSRLHAPLGMLLRVTWDAVSIVLICWIVGGPIGVALAAAMPDFFTSTFTQAPSEHRALLRFAWVGGTIWGAYGGTAIAALAGCVLFHLRWRRTIRDSAEGQRFTPIMSVRTSE
jgi:hypothetical protein